VAAATVIDGRQPHSVLLEVFTTRGNGTMVVPAAPVVEPVETQERGVNA
jgi:acetylglutamate kinase